MFDKGEKATPSMLPTLKRKVGYNDTEKRSDKRDKMMVDHPAREEWKHEQSANSLLNQKTGGQKTNTGHPFVRY